MVVVIFETFIYYFIGGSDFNCPKITWRKIGKMSHMVVGFTIYSAAVYKY